MALWHLLVVIAGLLLILGAPGGRPAWLADARHYAEELATISHRIATAAGSFCPAKAPLLGFSLHDLSQYAAADRQSVKAAYGFDNYPLVLGVAENGPAARGDVQPGDSLIAVNGQRVPFAPSRAEGEDRVQAVWALLDAAARQGPVHLLLRRGEIDRDAVLVPVSGCGTRFELGSSPDIDAVADDSQVIVNVGALQFADGDDEAAAIIAHELAHNILHHRQKIEAAPRRERRNVARAAEEEADRLSIGLLERAGYDPRAIVRFWQRFLTQFPHNGNNAALRKRVALVRAEVAQPQLEATPPAAFSPPRP